MGITSYSVCLIAAALAVLSTVTLIASVGRYNVDLQSKSSNGEVGQAHYSFTLWRLCSDADGNSLAFTFTGCGDWNRSFPLVGMGSNVRRAAHAAIPRTRSSERAAPTRRARADALREWHVRSAAARAGGNQHDACVGAPHHGPGGGAGLRGRLARARARRGGPRAARAVDGGDCANGWVRGGAPLAEGAHA